MSGVDFGYVRLSEAPAWCIQYPTCSACEVELDTDGGGWTCPNCGTSWDMQAGDGDRGCLYADWSGEESDGPIVTESEARAWGHYRDRLEAHRRWPDLVAEPKRPTVGGA